MKKLFALLLAAVLLVPCFDLAEDLLLAACGVLHFQQHHIILTRVGDGRAVAEALHLSVGGGQLHHGVAQLMHAHCSSSSASSISAMNFSNTVSCWASSSTVT